MLLPVQQARAQDRILDAGADVSQLSARDLAAQRAGGTDTGLPFTAPPGEALTTAAAVVLWDELGPPPKRHTSRGANHRGGSLRVRSGQ